MSAKPCGKATAWPWTCVSCGQRYAAFRVYARAGYDRLEYLVCAECGPTVPDWVETPPGGWSDVYPTILRPVPAIFDPINNPYHGKAAEKQTEDKKQGQYDDYLEG